ncbi:MAG: hypothetical protein ACI87N_001910, partial [Flavobacteriales bacterium]
MRTLRNFAIFSLVLLASVKQSAQHRSQLFVEVNHETNTLNIEQDIRFVNNTTDSLSTIVLNDWNNAYANVNTPLAKRFSDEFYRGFHLSNPEERGSTYSISILNDANLFLDWRRTPEHPDVI